VSDERAIGIDVGGTKIAAGAVDRASGAVEHRRERPTRPERGAEAVLATIEALARDVAEAMRREGSPPSGVGVGLPELVDADGRIRSPYLLDWSTMPLAERLGTIAPVTVSSDVRAAAVAESAYGAGQPFSLFAYVTIGTGISSTVVQDGAPLVGARGGAMVLSSGTLGVPCAECSGWTEFVLEQYASGPALARRYAAATGHDVRDAETVIVAANRGEPEAVAIVESAARALGSAIGWLVNVIDPEAIVIGGGLGLALGRFQERLTEAIREHVWNPGARSLPVLPAALGADAGLIGAALATSTRTAPVVATSERR
jgi:glucokinase